MDDMKVAIRVIEMQQSNWIQGKMMVKKKYLCYHLLKRMLAWIIRYGGKFAIEFRFFKQVH